MKSQHLSLTILLCVLSSLAFPSLSRAQSALSDSVALNGSQALELTTRSTPNVTDPAYVRLRDAAQIRRLEQRMPSRWNAGATAMVGGILFFTGVAMYLPSFELNIFGPSSPLEPVAVAGSIVSTIGVFVLLAAIVIAIGASASRRGLRKKIKLLRDKTATGGFKFAHRF